MHTSLKIPITKTQHSRQHMLNISDRQSRGGSTGGGGASFPQLLGTIHSAWCLTAVGNRCGHKKIFGHVPPPPPPPPPQHLLIQNPTDSTCLQSPTYQTGSTCLQNPCIREAAHAYKPNISDRLKMTNTSQKPNIQGKLTMRTDLKCQHITRA